MTETDKNLIERKCVFDRFVLPAKGNVVHQFDRTKAFKYDNKGVFFDISPECDAKTCVEAIGVTSGQLASGRFSYYKPETFQDFIICLQNTNYTSFVRFVSGDKTGENFLTLMNSFVKNNLKEQLDEGSIAEFTSQAYGVIMDDKAPKYYAYKQEMYKAKIEEILAYKESFEASFVGTLPTQEDYDFIQPETTSEVVAPAEQPKSIEEIVAGVIGKRNEQTNLNQGANLTQPAVEIDSVQ